MAVAKSKACSAAGSYSEFGEPSGLSGETSGYTGNKIRLASFSVESYQPRASLPDINAASASAAMILAASCLSRSEFIMSKGGTLRRPRSFSAKLTNVSEPSFFLN